MCVITNYSLLQCRRLSNVKEFCDAAQYDFGDTKCIDGTVMP